MVDFPENEDLTQSDKGLGAIFTIAPEMKRDPKRADASKADVFSLAKTLWMFLSGDEKGFDGVYNYLDKSHSLRYVSRFRNEHLVELDELLKDSTDNNPDLRPDIHQFKERLISWIEIWEDDEKSQVSDWHFLTKQLFGSNIPSSCTWRDMRDIINVLNIVGSTPAYNHMFFSDNGGLDFSHAEKAHEEGCIYIYDTCGFCNIVKPKSLIYEGFSDDYRWSYFLLNLKETNPVIQKYDDSHHEYLVEDFPGHYVSAKYAQYGVYDYDAGNPFPEGYREVYRYLEGKFLIVLKYGPYNQISGTYDGRHGMCDSDEFREYIVDIKEKYTELKKKAGEDEDFSHMSDEEMDKIILNIDYFNRNPFAPAQANEDILEYKKRAEQINLQRHYISEHFQEWDFSDVINNITDIGNPDLIQIKYYFKFNLPNRDIRDLLKRRIKCVCTDGFIKNISKDALEDCFFVYSREEATDITNKLNEKITQMMVNKGFSGKYDTYQYFSVSLCKAGKPTHLFTKSEIEQEMRNADDRITNQLVINENGEAKVIKYEENGKLYPVRCESWDAGNLYVGKYSSLSSLDENYIACLQGWLRYLQTGQRTYMDIVDENQGEESLIAEIKEYY